jgi:uncharacterized protein YgiM (DUF1202 family)
MTGVVTGNVVNVRAGPGTDQSRIAQLELGAQVRVLGANTEGTWYEILTPSGQRGWVSAEWVKARSEPADSAPTALASVASSGGVTLTPEFGLGEVIANTLDLRAAPNAEAAIVGKLTRGQIVHVQEASADESFYRVLVPGGTGGWVSAQLLTLQKYANTAQGAAGQASANGTSGTRAGTRASTGVGCGGIPCWAAILGIPLVFLGLKLLIRIVRGESETVSSADRDSSSYPDYPRDWEYQMEKHRKWEEQYERKREEFREEHGRDPGFFENWW